MERSQLVGFGHLTKMPPWHITGEVFFLGMGSGHTEEITSLGWVGNALVSPRKSRRMWPGRRKPGCLCLGCCPHGCGLDKQQKVDGSIYDGHFLFVCTIIKHNCQTHCTFSWLFHQFIQFL